MSLTLQFMTRQRYNDSTATVVKHEISGPLDEISWSYNRIGGCNKLRASWVFPLNADGTEWPDERAFPSPTFDDWTNSDWFGGEVRLTTKYQAVPVQSIPNANLWRGRITRISYKSGSREIDIEAEGLVYTLDEIVISQTWNSVPIRQIIEDVAAKVIRTGASGELDTYILGSSVVGLNSLLELEISLDAKWESARSIIQKVFRYLPDGMVWGVDRDGILFVDQQTQTFEEDLSGSGLVTINIGDQATRWDRKVQLDQLKTNVRVLGDVSPFTGDRVESEANCEKARALYGLRQIVVTDDSIKDRGLAAKVAAATCKQAASLNISARCQTNHMIDGQRSFWQSVTPLAPMVAVHDLTHDGNIVEALPELGSVNEYSLRRYGDHRGYALAEQGSAGAEVQIPSHAGEQAWDKGWLLHITLRMDFPQSGSGNSDFIFGRIPNSGASDYGWGSLWWDVLGNFYWKWTNSVGTTRNSGAIAQRLYPDNTVLNLTIWRDNVGDFRFYDGNTETALLTIYRTDTLQTSTDPWKFFDHDQSSLPGTDVDGDFAMDEFWTIQTSNTIETYAGWSTAELAVEAFIARNNQSPLRMNDGAGLATYCRFANPTAAAGPPLTFPVHQVGALQTATYTRSGAPGTENGAVCTASNRIGHVIGQRKKWGGPLVLNADSVTYRMLPAEGHLERTLDLGRIPVNAWTTLARVEDQIKKTEERLRRVTQSV